MPIQERIVCPHCLHLTNSGGWTLLALIRYSWSVAVPIASHSVGHDDDQLGFGVSQVAAQPVDLFVRRLG
jgi:hypothetical protein